MSIVYCILYIVYCLWYMVYAYMYVLYVYVVVCAHTYIDIDVINYMRLCVYQCAIFVCNKRQAQRIRTIQNSLEKAGGFHEVCSHLTPWESPPCHVAIRMNWRGSPSIPTSTRVSSTFIQIVWAMVSTMFQHVFFWGSYMIYSGSWSPQLQLPQLSLWMSQRASPCRGWLSKTITTWLWPREALKLVVQHETHHVSSCFNPSPNIKGIQQPICKMSHWGWWSHF